ncbi:MAG: sugar ABC transporter permease [Clostridia bacterium]|nr:sugar ABC transporter permease [Clostridia bacterium]
MRAAAQIQIKTRGKYNFEKLKQQMTLQSMVVPGIIYLVIFSYIPLAGLVIAFQDFDLYQGVFGSHWVGFKHFIQFFSGDQFFRLMKNTLCISLLKLLFGFPAPIILALLFNEIRQQKTRKAIQTVTYLPHFISWVVVAGMISSMMAVDGGTLNNIALKLGWIDKPVNFLSEPKYFRTILVAANVWKTVGFNAIIFIAAIAGINPELYEAASVDGATRFKQMFVVTLPCIVPQIVIMLIMNVSQILNAGFDDILLLTNNGENSILLEVGDVLDTYVYRYGIKLQRYSYGTAVGLFKSVVSIIMLFVANGISKSLTENSLW